MWLKSGTKKIVAISADELSYDEQRNILMASLTVEQINSLPAASSCSLLRRMWSRAGKAMRRPVV